MLGSDQLLICEEFVVFSEIEAYHMQSVISSHLGNWLSTVPDKPVKRNVCAVHPDTYICSFSLSESTR